MPTSVIVAFYTGQLSMGGLKILRGDVETAQMAHWYWTEHADNQTNVVRYLAKPSEYDYADLGRLYKIVKYEINDLEALKDWWFNER